MNTICRVYPTDNAKQQYANAQLIAAAPELLEAAKKIQKLADENRIEITDNSHSAQLFFDELFKAIQKAEGDNDD